MCEEVCNHRSTTLPPKCHARDFTHQALTLFSVQHWKAGWSMGNRLCECVCVCVCVCMCVTCLTRSCLESLYYKINISHLFTSFSRFNNIQIYSQATTQFAYLPVWNVHHLVLWSLNGLWRAPHTNILKSIEYAQEKISVCLRTVSTPFVHAWLTAT